MHEDNFITVKELPHFFRAAVLFAMGLSSVRNYCLRGGWWSAPWICVLCARMECIGHQSRFVHAMAAKSAQDVTEQLMQAVMPEAFQSPAPESVQESAPEISQESSEDPVMEASQEPSEDPVMEASQELSGDPAPETQEDQNVEQLPANFSEWVPYNTSDMEQLAQNLADGKVVY